MRQRGPAPWGATPASCTGGRVLHVAHACIIQSSCVACTALRPTSPGLPAYPACSACLPCLLCLPTLPALPACPALPALPCLPAPLSLGAVVRPTPSWMRSPQWWSSPCPQSTNRLQRWVGGWVGGWLGCVPCPAWLARLPAAAVAHLRLASLPPAAHPLQACPPPSCQHLNSPCRNS